MTKPEYFPDKVKTDGLMYIFSEDGQQMLFEVRGWGGLTAKGLSEDDALRAQVEWLKFASDAINEKIERENVKLSVRKAGSDE